MSDIVEKAYLSLWVSKEFKQQVEWMADNDRLKETVIREYLEKEVQFMKDEIKGVDDILLIYRAKLVDIRDGFAKAQELYSEELDVLSNNTAIKMDAFDNKFKILKSGIDSIKKEGNSLFSMISQLSESVSNINVGNLERLLDAVDRFNRLGEKEKELITLILKKD